MKNASLFLALLTVVGLSAQTPLSVPKGRILTTEGEKIRFTKFQFDTLSHRYQDIGTGQARSIPATRVLSVEAQTGTEAGKWAAIMGVAGLAGSLLGVIRAKADAHAQGLDTDDVNVAPLIIGITAGSALVGLAIGAGKKTYKKVYINPQYESSSMAPVLRVGLCAGEGRGLGAGLQLRF
jgi:hypothetical protein